MGNSLSVVTGAALIVLLAYLFFTHASMSVHGDFCAVLFHAPAHAHGHADNASWNACWLLSVAVFRAFPHRRFPRVGCCPSHYRRDAKSRNSFLICLRLPEFHF